jgi:hypothetical protein
VDRQRRHVTVTVFDFRRLLAAQPPPATAAGVDDGYVTERMLAVAFAAITVSSRLGGRPTPPGRATATESSRCTNWRMSASWPGGR